jgi:predicted enzyme related to lactoylglutathione lyase
MQIGEVGVLTGDVPRLAEFCRLLLGLADAGGEDSVHRTLIAGETALTVYNDGSPKNNHNQNICLAFTVPDVDAEYTRLLALGVDIQGVPVTRPWGARNMSLLDPDGNRIYLRSFPKAE